MVNIFEFFYRQLLIDNVIREELKELKFDIDLQEEIYKEIQEEANLW